MNMQQQTKQQDTGAIAFRYGLIWAGIFTILQIIVLLIIDLDSVGYAGTIANLLNLLLSLALFFIVGMLAARQTGQVNRGAMAGYFTGTFGGVLSLIVQLIVVRFTLDQLRPRVQQTADLFDVGFHYNNEAVFAGMIFSSVVGLLFAIGLGAGMGALGGLLGKRQAKVPATARSTAPLPPPSQSQR